MEHVIYTGYMVHELLDDLRPLKCSGLLRFRRLNGHKSAVSLRLISKRKNIPECAYWLYKERRLRKVVGAVVTEIKFRIL
jgi:hypothetical protein